jgi:hypothetical protein
MTTARPAGGTRPALALSIAGGAAVAGGAVADGYLQAVCLELGAAVLLLAPLALAEGAVTGRIGRRVEDGVAEALNGVAGAPHPEDVARIRDHLVERLRRSGGSWRAVRKEDGPFDLVLERLGHRVAVAIRQTPFALDSATVRRLHTEARRQDHGGLVVVSLTSPTDLAVELAAHTPGLALLVDNEDLDIRLGAALREVATR